MGLSMKGRPLRMRQPSSVPDVVMVHLAITVPSTFATMASRGKTGSTAARSLGCGMSGPYASTVDVGAAAVVAPAVAGGVASVGASAATGAGAVVPGGALAPADVAASLGAACSGEACVAVPPGKGPTTGATLAWGDEDAHQGRAAPLSSLPPGIIVTVRDSVLPPMRVVTVTTTVSGW